MKKLLLTTLLVSLTPLHAQTNTNNFSAESVLSPSCIIQANNISFFDLKPGQTTAVQMLTAQLNALCTKGTPFTIKLSPGNGTYAQRNMVSPDSDDKLLYHIYTRINNTISLGDGSTGTGVYTGVGNNNFIPYLMYLRINRNQYVTPGLYTDELTLTIEY